MPGLIPAVESVLAWRWRLACIIRLAAACVVAWVLWGWLRIVIGEVVFGAVLGRTPFRYLFEGTDPSANMVRREFLTARGREGGAAVLAVIGFVLARRLSALIVAFPRPMRRCAGCGYSLDRLADACCPECGLDVPATSLMPAAPVSPPPAPAGPPPSPS